MATISLNTKVLQDFLQVTQKKYTEKDAELFALFAMALVAVTSTEDLPKLKQQSDILNMLQNLEKQYPQVFIENSRIKFSEIVESEWFELITYLAESKGKGLFHRQSLLIWLNQLLLKPDVGSISFHRSFYDLCHCLFSQIPNGNIYLPFETDGYSSAMLSEQPVIAEGLGAINLPILLNLILGNITYQQGDAVRYPTYLKNGKLQKFSKGFLDRPWGVRIILDEQEIERFDVAGNNYQNYLIQHLFQQVEDYFLVVVPSNTLFSGVASEEKLRKWLLNQKHLQAVMNLPNGIVTNTGIQVALMIFDLRREFDEVIFLSNKAIDFTSRQGRETQLINIPKLIEILNGKPYSHSTKVSYSKIAEQGYVLDPERYVLSESSQKALAVLADYPTVKLGDITEILRPILLPKLKEEGNEIVYEIQGGDLPEYGEIQSASKENLLSKVVLDKNPKAFLQAGDILITVRGATGKVGIISKALLEQYQGRVIAGQTLLVLRPNIHKIHPESLLLQLKAEFTQARLQLISAGAVIAGLSLKDLKEFPIALFNLEQQQEQVQRFKEQSNIQQKINQMQNQMYKLGNDIWSTKN